ncbi:MAG: molybdopterin-dependent oxidoreductase [Thaumarchaeota archaeon]|nr:molybdopterin-dependent oxidoreductase [Nitrososphaerota archaeon]
MATGSICSYCGCGCRLLFVLDPSGKVITKVRPDQGDPASQGSPCVKGLTLHEVLYENRVLHPMVRVSKDGDLKRASWGEALKFVYGKLKTFDPREVFFVPSGKITNEDNYVLQKFARIVFKTNNVDSCCTRLCHAPTVKALTHLTGLGASEGVMDDVFNRDVLLIVGTNPASNYPVLFHRIVNAKRSRGLKVVSIQTVYNETANYADVALTVNPGTEVVLFNAMMGRLIADNHYDPPTEALDGFDGLREVVNQYDLNRASSICGCRITDVEAALMLIGSSKKLGVMHGMGLTQHRNAMSNLYSLFNLMLLKGGLLVSNRGEVNVQGVGDMGCHPDSLPTGPMITGDKLSEEWHVDLPSFQGKTMLEAFLISPVKAAVVSNFNPAQSLPNLDQVHRNLRGMFLVVLESHHSLTSEFADVILPVPSLPERTGSVTTGERRVRPVVRVIDPLGEAKPDWQIICELAELAGHGEFFDYPSEKEIAKEIVRVIPDYKEVDVAKLYSGEDQWANKKPKFARFNPVHFRGLEEDAGGRFPLILVSFRSPHHFLTNEMTSQSKTLSKFPEGPYVYLNVELARKLGVQNGDMVRVTSPVSYVDGEARISPKVPLKIVGMHFHFKSLLFNKLVPTQFDPEVFTPNYKSVPVNVAKLS